MGTANLLMDVRDDIAAAMDEGQGAHQLSLLRRREKVVLAKLTAQWKRYKGHLRGTGAEAISRRAQAETNTSKLLAQIAAHLEELVAIKRLKVSSSPYLMHSRALT
jgi:transposase